MREARRLSLLLATACVTAVACDAGALAQGGTSSTNISRNGEDAANRAVKNEGKPQTAQVGAGTTSASTNGSSGPRKPNSGAKDPLESPPPPNASQCDLVKNTGAYQGCLDIVLRHTGGQQR
jgi:hypothetical protein